MLHTYVLSPCVDVPVSDFLQNVMMRLQTLLLVKCHQTRVDTLLPVHFSATKTPGQVKTAKYTRTIPYDGRLPECPKYIAQLILRKPRWTSMFTNVHKLRPLLPVLLCLHLVFSTIFSSITVIVSTTEMTSNIIIPRFSATTACYSFYS